MPRRARLVVPDVPHHVTQRGFDRRDIFFSDEDRLRYLDLLTEGCRANITRYLAWCLMDNHVHLVLVPSTVDGLRATLSSAHTRYRRWVQRDGKAGPVFQVASAAYP